MPGKRFFGIIFVIALGIGLLVASSLAFQDNQKGEATFEARCAACHGADLKADTRIGKMVGTPDLTVRTSWKRGTSEKDVEDVIREGPGKMPAFKDKLNEEEIKAVAEYLRHLAGVDKPAKK